MGSHSPCASCKFLRRRCTPDCVFAPFFPPDELHKFAMVHRVFGASNVSKMLQDLPLHQRADAVSSLVYEANARMRDPVYGCVGAISYLQHQVSQLQMQLAVAQAEMLCIQMQRAQLMDADGMQYLMQSDLSAMARLTNYPSSSSNVPHEPLKRENPWA
ncbi:unnamed protein product [Musa textilis]